MNQNMNLPNNPQLGPGPGPRKGPMEVVARIGEYINAGIMLIAKLVLAALAVSVAYVALRAIWFAARIVLKAIGI